MHKLYESQINIVIVASSFGRINKSIHRFVKSVTKTFKQASQSEIIDDYLEQINLRCSELKNESDKNTGTALFRCPGLHLEPQLLYLFKCLYTNIMCMGILLRF